MPIDGVFLTNIVTEIKEEIINTRLDKINQPDACELRLQFKSHAGERKILVLSSRPGEARIHFTCSARENPETPPMFCMLARKSLAGARLIDIEQPPAERLVTLFFSCYNDFGDPCVRKIAFELAGKIPNVLLLNEDNRIIDCLRRVNIDDRAENRPMLPGLVYRPPLLPSDRIPFTEATDEQLADLTRCCQLTPEAFLKKFFYGLSPLVCHEIAANSPDKTLCDFSAAETEAFINRLTTLRSGTAAPCAVLDNNDKLLGFSFTDLLQFGEHQKVYHFSTCSELLDFCYASEKMDVSLKNAANDLSKPVRNAVNRLEKKLALQQTEYDKADDRERMRELGDILNAFLYQIPRGAAVVNLPDLYNEEGGNVDIPLDPKLSPQRNAQKYYTNYRKMKSARTHLETLIHDENIELAYLKHALYEISVADAEALKAIQNELAAEGITKPATRKMKRNNEKALPPKEYTLSNGMTLLCGRTSKQNEQLTFTIAAKSDWWFHVKNAPGSHCILRCNGEPPTDEAFEEAAAYAAENSSLGKAGHIAVDYSPVKNIKKMPGGKPGMVIYEKYYTLYTK